MEGGVEGWGNLLAAANKVVESTHGLLWTGVGIEAVDLEKVDVIHFQALEGCIDSRKNGVAGESWKEGRNISSDSRARIGLINHTGLIDSGRAIINIG